jgi:hypothetical protein
MLRTFCLAIARQTRDGIGQCQQRYRTGQAWDFTEFWHADIFAALDSDLAK